MQTLQYISCANVDVEPGKIVYTQWLNERGGIEADLTISRLNEESFHVITSISSLTRDWSHLNKHLMTDTFVEDISMDFACLSVQGTNSRNVLQEITDTSLENSEFKFATGRYCKIAGVDVWIQKLSYVGELGWEIFISKSDAITVYKAIKNNGREFNLCDVGLHAVNSLRLEKGYRHWGHDIAAEDNLFEAGLSFVAKPDGIDFIGKDAYLKQAARSPERKLVQFKLNDPGPMLYHNEPIIMNGQVNGYITSGMYGHSLGSAVGMGYVNCENLTKEKIKQIDFEIEIATERYDVEASLISLYDPDGSKMKL